MKTLITGGAGFIGSHLVEYLALQGEQIVILDDFTGSKEVNLSSSINNEFVEVVSGSILDQNLVTELMQSASKCYHLAAILGVEKINSDPIKSLDVNIKGSEIVLSTASKFKVRTLITSSSEVYGRNPKMPLSEESDRVLGSPRVARWTYSEAKAIDELYAFELNKKGFVRSNNCTIV